MTDEKANSEVVAEAVADVDEVTEVDVTAAPESLVEATPPRDWQRLIGFVVLPAVVVLLGALAGFLKWQSESQQETSAAAAESLSAARDATAAILSYSPATVDKDLNAARDRLTGSFLDSYTKLVNDVVIPGSKQKNITAVAQVPAAASVSATPNHAVALVFVNQATTIGNDAPTNTTSSVQVTLEKVHGRWLVSGFDPV